MPENRDMYAGLADVTFPSLPIQPSQVRLPGLQADAVSRRLSQRPEDRSTRTSSSISRTVPSELTAAA